MVPYERIGWSWPVGPEREGVSEEYYQTLLLRQLPFSAEHPLLFHVLTTLEAYGDGESQLLELMADGVELVPYSEIEQARGGMLFARDIVAGDDHYLFTTPCNVFAESQSKAKYNPAVAFDARWVASQHSVAFRVHDMEPSYKMAEQLAGDPEMLGIDEEEYEALTLEEQEFLCEEEIALAVQEQLEIIAECGTQYEQEGAGGLVLLYAELCGAFRAPPYRLGSEVPLDNPRRQSIYERAMPLFPGCLRGLMGVGKEDASWISRDVLDEHFVLNPVEDLVKSWQELFGGAGRLRGFPWQLFYSPADRRPEVLVKGTLPLCEAKFYRDGKQRWVPVPEEVCRAGRQSASRRRAG